MKRFSFILSALFLSFVLIIFLTVGIFADETEEQEKHIEVDYSVSCMECHQEETPEQTNEWRQSAHGVMNFGCYMCHGDGEEEFYPRPGSEKCISCHSDQEVDFSKTPLNNCFDCHQGHTLKFHKE